MSKIEKDVSTIPEVTPNAVQVMNYSATAQERIQELLRWREQVPRFVIPPTTDATRRMNNAASVSAEFVELTNIAVANEAAMVRQTALTPDETRDLAAYADAFGPLADQLDALSQFIRFSVKSARNAVGVEALTRYSLAVRLAKQPATAGLAPMVADMRRALGRTRKPTPEEAAKKAAERAERAAKRVAKGAATTALIAAPPDSTAKPE